MSRVTHMPEVISLLIHFQGKSIGFTMKPFESPPNKLVAARFQWQVHIGVLLQEGHCTHQGRKTTIHHKAPPPLAPFGNH